MTTFTWWELARAWSIHAEDMVDDIGLSDMATVNVTTGKLHPYINQPASVQDAWRQSYQDAFGGLCQTCGRNGKNEDCPDCCGQGQQEDDSKFPDVPCPTCKGTGKVRSSIVS